MVILDIRMKNLYSFEDEFVDFSYSKNNNKGLVEYEFLKDFPKIKFKKLNILMGHNASGKTKFGDLLNIILLLISKGNYNFLRTMINDEKKTSSFKITVLSKESENYYIHSYECDFTTLEIKKLIVSKVRLTNKQNSLEFYKEKLSEVYNLEKEEDLDLSIFKKFTVSSSWSFKNEKSNQIDYFVDKKLLELVLKAFDPNIEKVVEIDGDKFQYQIFFKNDNSILIDNGKITDENRNRISSGTLEALDVIVKMMWIVENAGIYYFDELMTRVHTEFEVAILGVLVKELSMHELCQMFYTSHNLELLSLNYPVHNYLFLNNSKFINPEKIYGTDNKNFKIDVLNDIFDTIPCTDLFDDVIERLEELNYDR